MLENIDLANPNDAATEHQIERILHSETLRASEALRRLLRYLADKTFSGEADQLKEYTVGIDGLGKPATYDPRQSLSSESRSDAFATSCPNTITAKAKVIRL